ncbi:Gx transporter family protein [Eubacterium sp.]|uniref:Gx transporter family protein n=1 Tax=Eubacterium sp. TaxID=142586 RepID=UPI003522C016
MSTKRIANMAMLVALAIIFSYVEFLIPINLGIPGIKLGLANLVIVIALYTLELGDVWIISILRILIIGFMFGSGMSIIYSLAGAVVSLIVMTLMKKINGFSIMGISMIGAVAHNMGQIVVAMFVVENTSILYYVPALLIAGLITGGIMGIVSKRVLTVIKK